MRDNNTSSLCLKLAYSFENADLLKQALTHRSYPSKHNNERLEFLGDAILSFIITNALYDLFPDFPEGDLSRLRSALVRGETLAEIALEIKLGNYLYLGQGEQKTGGFRRTSILADALEALFAAIYLDAGMDATKKCILKLFDERLKRLSTVLPIKDPKTALQEYLQAHQLPLPQYQLEGVKGLEHDQTFIVSCRLSNPSYVIEGSGSSRRRAERDAASRLLAWLVEK